MNPEKQTKFLIALYWWTIVVLTVASFLIPKGNDVYWINGHHTEFLDAFFKWITHLGEGWIFIPVLVISLFIRFSLSLSIVSMAALHGIICAVVKKVLFTEQFARPAALLDNHLLHFVSGVQVHMQHSFPSGHTATIFCFAVLVSILIGNRTASVLVLLIALLVGYSRIYLLQHFIIDVTAGALVGVGSAFIVLYVFDRLSLPSWSATNLGARLRRA